MKHKFEDTNLIHKRWKTRKEKGKKKKKNHTTSAYLKAKC